MLLGGKNDLAGVRWMYLFDALELRRHARCGARDRDRSRRTARRAIRRCAKAIAEGLRFVVSNKALAGSFVIDINAMLFGMPRALFAVLSLTVYHAGAGGTGLLYTRSRSAERSSVLGSGWVQHVNRLGRLTIAMVVLWGLAIGGAGLVRSIAPAAILLGSRAGPTASAPSAARRSVRRSRPTACAGG